MTKQKDLALISPNTYRNRRIAWGATLLLGSAAFLGAHVARGGGSAEPGVSKTQLAAEGVARLEGFQAKHHNILSVLPDTKNPGLERVTYTFTPGHNTISHLAAEVAPNQIRDDANTLVEGYNDGSEITHYGQKLNVDVDPVSGFIVENPDLPSSAENDS